MIRVFLADDHGLVRDGVRRILEHTADLQVVGEAGDGESALRALDSTPCDVLVLDVQMPNGGGVEVLKSVRAKHPRVAVLVLSMYAEDQVAARLLRSGAAGYLTKGRSADELVDAIRKVAQGGRYVTATIAEHLLDVDEAPAHEGLSTREHQVFLLISQGKSPSEISNELRLSPSTVSTYIARIKKQIGAQTIGEIVRYAARAGLI